MSRRFFRHQYWWPGSTMVSIATMAISLLCPLWWYCHKGHSAIDYVSHQFRCLKKRLDLRNAASGANISANIAHFDGILFGIHMDIFFLYKFWDSFVYFSEKWPVVTQHLATPTSMIVKLAAMCQMCLAFQARRLCAWAHVHLCPGNVGPGMEL